MEGRVRAPAQGPFPRDPLDPLDPVDPRDPVAWEKVWFGLSQTILLGGKKAPAGAARTTPDLCLVPRYQFHIKTHIFHMKTHRNHIKHIYFT